MGFPFTFNPKKFAYFALHQGNLRTLLPFALSLPKTNGLWHSEAADRSPDTQVVLRLAFIRGRGCERFCTVSAVKVNDPTAANLAPYCCPIKVQDNDNFSDGHYELVLGAQTFVMTKMKGEYQAIVQEASPNNAASS